MTKAKTKYLDFDGVVAWCRLYPGQEDEYGGNRFWKMNFYPDEDTRLKMKAAGIQLRFKDDDGEKSGIAGKYVVLKRPTEKEFDGEIQKFLPAQISDKSGILVKYKVNEAGDDFEQVGEKVVIGNGSKVRVTLEVYDTKRFGKGTRLRSVKILDLVEYIPPEDVSDNEYDGDDDTPFDTKDQQEEALEAVAPAKSKKVKW